jgi:hypothetical protein
MHVPWLDPIVKNMAVKIVTPLSNRYIVTLQENRSSRIKQALNAIASTFTVMPPAWPRPHSAIASTFTVMPPAWPWPP